MCEYVHACMCLCVGWEVEVRQTELLFAIPFIELGNIIIQKLSNDCKKHQIQNFTRKPLNQNRLGKHLGSNQCRQFVN